MPPHARGVSIREDDDSGAELVTTRSRMDVVGRPFEPKDVKKGMAVHELGNPARKGTVEKRSGQQARVMFDEGPSWVNVSTLLVSVASDIAAVRQSTAATGGGGGAIGVTLANGMAETEDMEIDRQILLAFYLAEKPDCATDENVRMAIESFQKQGASSGNDWRELMYSEFAQQCSGVDPRVAWEEQKQLKRKIADLKEQLRASLSRTTELERLHRESVDQVLVVSDTRDGALSDKLDPVTEPSFINSLSSFFSRKPEPKPQQETDPKQLAELMKSLRVAEMKIGKLERELIEENTAGLEATNQVERLSKQLWATRQQNDELSKRFQQLEKDYSHQREELVALRAQTESVEDLRGQLDEQSLSRQASKAAKEKEIAKLKAQLKSSTSNEIIYDHWECEMAGNWIPYDAEVSKLLSDAHRVKDSATFMRGKHSYSIDFSEQSDGRIYSQLNLSTGRRRQVRWSQAKLGPMGLPAYFGPSTDVQLAGCDFRLEKLGQRDLAKLNECIKPQDPATLGSGRDVSPETQQQWEAIPTDRRQMTAKRAWRVHHDAQWVRYCLEKVGVKSAMPRVPAARRPDIALRDGFAAATAQLPGTLDKEVNEEYLITGVPQDVVISLLQNGANERFNSRGNFGAGSYFAEDGAKNDQYTGTPDTDWDESCDLHKLLYPSKTDHPSDAGVGVNYLLVCRVILGCSVRTNGRGRFPTCLDEGATMTNAEGDDGFVFWAHADDPDLEIPDVKGWKELGRIADVTGQPYMHYDSLVVETSTLDWDEIIRRDTRGLDTVDLLGGVERFREFVIFHGARIYPEYLVAYAREGDVTNIAVATTQDEPAPAPVRIESAFVRKDGLASPDGSAAGTTRQTTQKTRPSQSSAPRLATQQAASTTSPRQSPSPSTKTARSPSSAAEEKLRAKLQLAALKGRHSEQMWDDESVPRLIQAGAPVNGTDRAGLTALMEAVKNGHTQCVKLLLEAGADRELHTTNGRTALDWAREKEHEEMIQLLAP